MIFTTMALLGLPDSTMTEIGHTLIIVGVAAGYLKAQKVQTLVEVQKDTIDTLQKGFDACKTRLADLERKMDR